MQTLAGTTPIVIGEVGEHDCSYGLIHGTAQSPTQQDLLDWSDQHGSGIYSFAYLRELCEK